MRHRGKQTARILAGVAVVVAAGGLAACGRTPPPETPPTTVLVTLDTLPADRIGTYGHPQARTPFLDRLARRGILVRDAIAPTPLTLPSHATLLTGLDPPTHGVRENGIFRLEDSFDTVAELLPDEVETAAFVAAFPVTARFNLNQGFDRYDDDLGRPERPGSPAERRADEVFRLAGDWLEARTPGAPAFVWAHAFDPHYPYDPPAPWPRALRAGGGKPYDAEVAFTDRALGGFLRRAGAFAEPAHATVVVAADHGESLGRHGEITHSLFIYDATQRVPLVAAGPGIAPALETRQRALIDVAPTLLESFGQPPADVHVGTSLLEAPGEDLAYVETKHTELLRGWSPLHGVRTSRWKYIRAPRPELYDLLADPGETDNRHAADPETAERFETILAGILAAGEEASGGLALDEEAAERLRALGYVAAIEPGSGADLAKDPKDGVEGAAALFRGEEAYVAGRLLVAQRHLERAIELDPESKDAHAFLSGTLVGLYDYSGAARHARRALELPPHLNEGPLHGALGEALLALAKFEEAAHHLRIAAEARPNDAKIARLLAEAEARTP